MAPPRDILEFLRSYPGQKDDASSSKNWEFYAGIPVGKDQAPRRCTPDNLTIDELHAAWSRSESHETQYETLEVRHGYIQWLFPIREQGVNGQAQPLQMHEISKMKADHAVIARLIRSYRLMLDFYGMQLVSEETGLIARSPSHAGRYRNFLRRSHNWLRISRILKCLSELGLERLNAGFLLHVLNEQSEFAELNSRGLQDSMDRWWANCLRDQGAREWIGDQILKVRAGEGNTTGPFTFTRKAYESALERRGVTGKLAE
ncbi:hypothetical protein FIBSPDRAFT_307046 [Athelia psychrophila]|uniref:Opioid growth factor receptor (OGFr) conserved domain-containing protein n=1 Tax=Athelia psychrophila TaxID=1759441 RepID=A0A166W6I2_9AGAM|nr:hypothetical protein FIBSPDRAFT_307046 [Fibularhizoctonia sp. CBS 109695]